MANYFDDGVAPVPFTADVDLTAYQWRIVAPASTVGYVEKAVTACGVSGRMPIGVLVNDPSTAQLASVKMFGFTKAKARVNACNLDHGAWLKAASDGFFEPLATVGTDIAVGRWFGSGQTTADASVLGNVFLSFMNACNSISGS